VSFLTVRSLAYMVVALGALSGLGAGSADGHSSNQISAFPPARRAPVTPTKALKKHHYPDRQYSTQIQHVIVVIEENRSFNNLFANFPGTMNTTTYGLTPIAMSENKDDPPHGYESAYVPE
jgi:phospholipase C